MVGVPLPTLTPRMRISAPHLLAPLDALRGAVLRASPWLRPFVVSRELRVAAGGVAGILGAFALTLVAPLWMLALAPILLGVPHLLADVRYLVARPASALGSTWWLAIGLPVALVGLFVWPAFGVAAMFGAVWIARRPTRNVELLACGLLAGVALRWPLAFLLVFAHTHNAIALWMWWRIRERPAWHVMVPGLWWDVVSALLAGMADPLLLRAIQSGPIGWGAFEGALAPGLDAPWSMRLVATFAFAQSVHYGIWLRLVPDDTRRRATPRTFAATWRALQSDVGRPVLLGFCALALGIGVWSLFDLVAAHTGYLRLAVFHGYLELAALALPAWMLRER